MKVAVGDLVRGIYQDDTHQPDRVGIVVEVINGQEVPPVCKILWPNGQIEKEWTDDIEVVNGKG